MQAGDWLLRRALSESGLAGGGDGSDRGPSRRTPAGAMWSAGSGRAAGPALLGILLALSLSGGRAAKSDAGLVTCGSVLKLFNTQHRVRLHSHDIKYGSGARAGAGAARRRAGRWVPAGQRAGGPQGRRPEVSRARSVRRSERRTWECDQRRAGGGERLGEPLGPRVEVVGKAEVVRGEGRRCQVDGHPGDGVSSPGSGQQSVTGVEASDDANSYWRIRGGTEGECPRGSPVRCGQAVRLTHVLTGKNLHTHHFPSPLTNNQVSAPGL